jgi:hypothetical protein
MSPGIEKSLARITIQTPDSVPSLTLRYTTLLLLITGSILLTSSG